MCRRIVCLTEETTELLYLLGEEDRIVGISAYTVRPQQARKEKPVVSAFISGSIEKIKKLKPDLVIGFSDIQAQLSHDLVKEGLNVLITNQRTLAEIFETITLIGRLVRREKQTTKMISSWKSKIDEIEKLQKDQLKPKIFFQEWNDPIIFGIKWVSEIIKIAGGLDVFAEKASPMAAGRIVTARDVADSNPDIIIGSWCGKKMDFDWVRNNSEWQTVSAIIHNEIYEIDSSIILQPGPALFLEGLDTVVGTISNYQRKQKSRSNDRL